MVWLLVRLWCLFSSSCGVFVVCFMNVVLFRGWLLVRLIIVLGIGCVLIIVVSVSRYSGS